MVNPLFVFKNSFPKYSWVGDQGRHFESESLTWCKGYTNPYILSGIELTSLRETVVQGRGMMCLYLGLTSHTYKQGTVHSASNLICPVRRRIRDLNYCNEIMYVKELRIDANYFEIFYGSRHRLTMRVSL